MTLNRPALLAAIGLTLLGVIAPASAADDPLRFRCDGSAGDPSVIEAMENEYIEGTKYGGCWFHVGHHTYDMGSPHRLGVVTGFAKGVEIVFSPSTEFAPAVYLVLESSLDGVSWSLLHRIDYADRQDKFFAFDAQQQAARFLRIRQPRSAAQGLSGFLDGSSMTVEATPCTDCVAADPSATEMTCETHIMERFFDDHPCWTGGINRYDSPSIFHTYRLPAGPLARVTGSATFLPWRTDDYYRASSRTEISGHLQVSIDGVRWTTVATVRGTYGSAIAFDSGDLAGMSLSFARFVPEYHAQVREDPALKHARGFLVDSSLSVTAL